MDSFLCGMAPIKPINKFFMDSFLCGMAPIKIPGTTFGRVKMRFLNVKNPQRFLKCTLKVVFNFWGTLHWNRWGNLFSNSGKNRIEHVFAGVLCCVIFSSCNFLFVNSSGQKIDGFFYFREAMAHCICFFGVCLEEMLSVFWESWINISSSW